MQWCWDSNSRPLEHESPPITTRPGLLLLRYLPFSIFLEVSMNQSLGEIFHWLSNWMDQIVIRRMQNFGHFFNANFFLFTSTLILWEILISLKMGHSRPLFSSFSSFQQKAVDNKFIKNFCR